MFTLSGSGQERLKKRRSCGTKGRTVTIMKDNLVNESRDLVNDCISRQAVISTIYDNKSDFKNDFTQGFFADRIRDLPPVNTEKTGRLV